MMMHIHTQVLFFCCYYRPSLSSTTSHPFLVQVAQLMRLMKNPQASKGISFQMDGSEAPSPAHSLPSWSKPQDSPPLAHSTAWDDPKAVPGGSPGNRQPDTFSAAPPQETQGAAQDAPSLQATQAAHPREAAQANAHQVSWMFQSGEWEAEAAKRPFSSWTLDAPVGR